MNKLRLNIKENDILFFDMDGTLVDTGLANFEAYKHAINSMTPTNYDLSYNPKSRFNRTQLKATFPNFTEDTFRMIIEEKERIFKDYLNRVQLNVELKNLVADYSKTNKTCLVTNSRKDRVFHILDYFELKDLFVGIVFSDNTIDSILTNKYQKAIESMGANPISIIIFENDPIDIKVATNAGIPKQNIHNI